MQWAAERYPGGAFFALMESRYYRALKQPRSALDVAQAGLRKITEMPSVAVMFQYQSAWCALFLLDWAECARHFDSLLHSKPGGDYVGPAGADDHEKTTRAKAQAAAADDDDEEEEEVNIPPSKASAQGLYAYGCGLCYGMLGDVDRCRWYLRGVPSWLTPQKKNVDMFAVRKAEEILSRPDLSRSLLLLDVLELFIAWNGLAQTPAASLEKLSSLLSETATHQAALSRENKVRLHWCQAALTAARGQPAQARQQLQSLLSEQEKWMASSEYCKRAGVLAFVYYELANVCLAGGDLVEAKRSVEKSKSFKGYDAYEILQIKLHALEQKIKRTEDSEAEQ